MEHLSNFSMDTAELDKKLMNIELIESGEPFVDLKTWLTGQVVFVEDENKVFAVRETIAEAINGAIQYANDLSLVLKLEDAYRSLSTQKQKFKKRVSEMKGLHPDLTYEQVLVLANQFTAGIPILAAHSARCSY